MTHKPEQLTENTGLQQYGVSPRRKLVCHLYGLNTVFQYESNIYCIKYIISFSLPSSLPSFFPSFFPFFLSALAVWQISPSLSSAHQLVLTAISSSFGSFPSADQNKIIQQLCLPFSCCYPDVH